MKIFHRAVLLLPLLLLLSTPRIFGQEAPLFALTWHPADATQFTHQTPVVPVGGSKWINLLRARPEGRRAILVTQPAYTIWMHPNDRCRDRSGSLDHLSADPKGNGSMYRNDAGRDGKPSGFSCPWLDSWVSNERTNTQRKVEALMQNDVPLDYVIFDIEPQIDWVKISSSWAEAIMADPRWPAAKVVLDSLKRIATGDPSASFAFRSGKMTDGEAWNSYMWAHQARALNEGIFNVYQSAYPNLKGSNYEHHGRRPEDTTLETYGWHFYQTNVTGTHASDNHYGWIRQAKDVRLDVRKMGNDSDWLIFVFEQRKARASIRAGHSIQPWIAFSGTDFSGWSTAARAPQQHTPNPYWTESIRHLLMLKADPLLYWNSRTYKSTNLSSDVLDGYVEDVFDEINSRIGTASPRYTITTDPISWFGGPVNDMSREGRLPDGSNVVATGLRHGGQATYRVAVERITNDPQDWEEISVRVLQNGIDTGERIRIPAGETGAYYTAAFREGLSFQFAPSQVRSLVSPDLTDGTWTRSDDGTTPTVSDGPACPVDGLPVTRLHWKTTMKTRSVPVKLQPGKVYSFSAYLHSATSGRPQGGVAVETVEGNTIQSIAAYNTDEDGWARFSVTFRAGSDPVVPVVLSYRQYACAPALHEGVLPGRITAETRPYEPAPGEEQDGLIEQHITLQPGVNMVAFHVDPGNVSPDSILGGHPAVTLLKNPEGEVYSTRFSIRDIRVWDALQAYRVLAEEPVEITLKGRPLNMLWMDLDEGWNLVPYARSSPADIEDVLAAQPGVVLRVEDDRDGVYEPDGENVTLHSFEPGKAYRIYAKRAVRVTFPE